MEEISKVTKSRVHHGFNISIARNRKGLKQAALADMLGISQQRLSQLENQRVVKDEILEKVSEATGVSVEDLKTIEEPMSVYLEIITQYPIHQTLEVSVIVLENTHKHITPIPSTRS